VVGVFKVKLKLGVGVFIVKLKLGVVVVVRVDVTRLTATSAHRARTNSGTTP
jgi:hypothetical protein